jgi:transposase
MMGQHSRSESLFYYFRIEDQVPENHLLRLIDRHVSFDFVREKLQKFHITPTVAPIAPSSCTTQKVVHSLLESC